MEETAKQSNSIPFIIYEKSKFELNPTAMHFLSQYKCKIGIIAIWGKYRTGKSYLLSRLVEDKIEYQSSGPQDTETKGPSFNVGPSINACTKGLWLLKEPIYVTKNSETFPVFIIDSEGLCGLEEEQNHDTKIFLLSLLLSSLFIYNSVGSIDENALNALSLAINLSAQIEDLGEYFPNFLWVLRDFSLLLEDEDGNEITAKKYLELALKEQKGASDSIESK